MIELLPGLYRIETALGDNLLALHLIRGERTLLIDSGVRDTADTVIFPALTQADAFFAESLAFVERADAVILNAVRAADRPLTLSDVVATLDARLGPFAVAIQWVGPALAHLERHCVAGRLALHSGGTARAWVAAR